MCSVGRACRRASAEISRPVADVSHAKLEFARYGLGRIKARPARRSVRSTPHTPGLAAALGLCPGPGAPRDAPAISTRRARGLPEPLGSRRGATRPPATPCPNPVSPAGMNPRREEITFPDAACAFYLWFLPRLGRPPLTVRTPRLSALLRRSSSAARRYRSCDDVAWRILASIAWYTFCGEGSLCKAFLTASMFFRILLSFTLRACEAGPGMLSR